MPLRQIGVSGIDLQHGGIEIVGRPGERRIAIAYRELRADFRDRQDRPSHRAEGEPNEVLAQPDAPSPPRGVRNA